MTTYYINIENWEKLKSFLIFKFTTYGLIPCDNNLLWTRIEQNNIQNIVTNLYRATNPIKIFLFPAKEDVTKEPILSQKLIIGAKACDLAHLETTDSIFLGGVIEDATYALRRQNLFIISSDCDACKQSCFCTLMGGKPFPTKNFDINLSPINNGFIVETGSKKGEDLIQEKKELFSQPNYSQIDEREQKRKSITENVININKEYSWKDPKTTIENNDNPDIWKQDITKTCVECNSCRYYCGTCYCFLLGNSNQLWDRIRFWDSCQFSGYARVAGGANPRKYKWERLKNFYMCKFIYRYENFGFYACSGCGRCIDVCQGKIDIRKSLQTLFSTF